MEKITERRAGGKSIAGGKETVRRSASKIGASTPYDFGGGVLTPYGGLWPLTALWEKLGLLELARISHHWSAKQQENSGNRFDVK